MKQEEALAILKTGLNVFLTGEPGSGKTHTINRYVGWLRERGVEPSVTASTGIAATHIGGMTIHSWSGIGVKREMTDWDIEMLLQREKTAKRIMDAKVLIIDEISMLDAQTLTAIDRVLRALRRKVLREEEPFGGLQVIFVGDFFQLPPVSRGARAQFAFESPAWRAARAVCCYISEQHRQEDQDFLDMLKALREGTFNDAHLGHLKSRMNLPRNDEVATRLYTHNADVDRINNESLARIDGQSRVYEMQTRGPKALLETIKASCLSPERLELKEGAAVMFTRNNFEAGYVNGTLGEVVGFADSGYPVVKTRTGGRIEAAMGEWSIADGTKILAQAKQVPLRLAWAITVHKSQGMSLDAAVIDLGAAFEFGQGYVAISRVRSLSGLFLEGLNDRALQMHPKVGAADRYFRSYSTAAREKFLKLPIADKERLEQNFLKAIGAKNPAQVVTGGRAGSKLAMTREKYPNVGKPWKKEDDLYLIDLFAKKKPQKEIAARFGRKPSAIRARLGHLGLIENTWKPKGS